MSSTISHWGCQDESGGEGEYPVARIRPGRADAAIVLTEAGELLIHRDRMGRHCLVGIIIGKASTALSRPQVERMHRAWDVALAVANGNSEDVTLQPMPHHWRFSRTDYMTWDEWLQTRSGAGTNETPARPDDGRDVRR